MKMITDPDRRIDYSCMKWGIADGAPLRAPVGFHASSRRGAHRDNECRR